MLGFKKRALGAPRRKAQQGAGSGAFLLLALCFYRKRTKSANFDVFCGLFDLRRVPYVP
ncbi:hypothetical protein HanRHA438_Chr15g0712921 [Helianthus annuus]|nr:hypothetical protein HanRHA438_Chr15g0712921 [Helianthus annuus]